MRFPYLGLGRGLPTQTERAQILSAAVVHGSSKPPAMVRDVTAQAAPRGVQLTWAAPATNSAAIREYRVYVGTEKNLSQTLTDRGVRQTIVPVTAGATQNIFISSVDAHGNESPKLQVQQAAITESGAPPLPSPPAGFVDGNGFDKGDTGTEAGNNRLPRSV